MTDMAKLKFNGSDDKIMRILFTLSHPIQYFSPLFKEMAKEPVFDLLVLYCSDENIKNDIDLGFGSKAKWDIPLLEGYNYRFLKNNSWRPSVKNGFLGLINISIAKLLKYEKGNLIVIHGWNYFTNILAVFIGKILGYKICIRGDNPYNQEILKSKTLLFIKNIVLGKLFFRLIDYFLYVGQQNKEFYKYYGAPERKLVFTPHAVDNNRFRDEFEKNRNKQIEIRKELSLPLNKNIILTSGKYIPKKRPMDLLNAFHLLNDENAALVFLGDGELRSEMEEYIKLNKLNDVYLTGFKNQSEIGRYYSSADIFVLPSGAGETWGLVVNEAMNFSLPLILSNQIGCMDDLLHEAKNGYQFECANVIDLKTKLQILLSDKILRDSFGKESIKIIENYSYSSIIKSLKTLDF
jgi:glycosyltransferase involved in cell wall biosynthesis